MKYSHLLSEILRHPWAIEIGFAFSQLPIIHQMLEGNQSFQPRGDIGASIHVVDRTGAAHPIDGNYKEGSVAIITMVGALTKYGGDCHFGADDYAQYLRMAFANPRISGVVLRMDGPGGSVNAIQTMVETLQARNKPVITHADMAASAHYWVAAHTDFIMGADTISGGFGSIGVLLTWADMSEYYKKKGVELKTIYAPESTQKNSEWEEALKGNFDPLKNEVLSPLAQKFQQAVLTTRTKLKDKENALAGKFYSTERALEIGLIDGIGTMEEAIRKIQTLKILY